MPGKQITLGQFYTPSRVADWIVSLSETESSGRVLEAGYGEGAFLRALLRAGFSDIEGYDVDPENYKKVQGELGGEVRVRLQDFLLAPREEQFDLLIGNPPYVRWGNLSPKSKRILSEDPFWKQYSSGEWDLLYAFILGGVEMLRHGGEMIFIVPSNWFSSTFAKPVREKMRGEGHFTDIVSFGEYKIFPNAAPNAIVFRWKKERSRKKIRVVEFLGKSGNMVELLQTAEGLRRGLRRGVEKEGSEWRAFRAEQLRTASPWSFLSSADQDFVRVIEAKCPFVLSDVADVGVGMVSGFDEAFLVNESEYRSFSKKEKELVGSFVKAKDCRRFSIGRPSRFVWANHIKSEAELATCPAIFKHLESHKTALLARYGIQPNLWWHWATVRNLSLFEKNKSKAKIFVPCVDRSATARFSLTRAPYIPAGDVLIIAAKEGTDPFLLQSWLGSETFNRWCEIKGPRTGHRRRLPQSFLKGVPVPEEATLTSKQQKQLIDNTKKLTKDPDSNKRLIADSDKIWRAALRIK